MVRGVRLHGRELALRQRQAETEPEDDTAPSEPAEVDLTLPVGAEAELRSDDPGLFGSFYEVTVTGHLPSSGRYTVRYATLVSQHGGPLQETVAAAQVRPRPPAPPLSAGSGREFALHDAVEAFHNDGWWAGVVSAVPPPTPQVDCGRPRVYQVVFPTSRETMEFHDTALRPHRVFQDGRWVPASELADGRPPLFPVGTQVEVSRSHNSFGEFWSPASVLKVIGATSYLVRYTHIGHDGEEVATEIIDSQYIRPARTDTPMDSKYRPSPSCHVEVMHQGRWWPGVIDDVLVSGIGIKYAVKKKTYKARMDDVECLGRLIAKSTQLIRPRFDWDGKRWARHLTEEFVNATKLTSQKRPGSSALSLSKEVGESSDKKCSYRGKKFKSVDVVSEPISPEETVKQGNAAVALGSQLAPPSLPSMEGFAHFSDCSLAQSSHLEQASSQNIIITSAPLPQSQQLQASMLGTFGQPRPLLTPEKENAAKTIEEARNIVSMSEDLAKPNNGVDDVDLRYNVTNVTARRSEIDMVNCVDPATTTLNDVGGPHQGGGSCMDDRVSESRHLPFAKTSPLWAQIEGMEAFSRAPQRPHLNQLQQLHPLLREGVAIGLMVSFANLAETTSMLDDADDDNYEGRLLEAKMQTLSLLEEHGFEVGILRSRLETLLCRKNSRGPELRDDAMKALEEKIAHQETEGRELGVQIRMLAVALRDLGIYDRFMRDMMWSAVTHKLDNAVEISRLKAEANELELSTGAAAEAR